MNIQEQFEQFHNANPRVYSTLVKYTRIVKAAGFTRYSIKSLFERVRWHHEFESALVSNTDFELNNNFHSRYARKLMAENPEFAGLFQTRRLTAA